MAHQGKQPHAALGVVQLIRTEGYIHLVRLFQHGGDDLVFLHRKALEGVERYHAAFKKGMLLQKRFQPRQVVQRVHVALRHKRIVSLQNQGKLPGFLLQSAGQRLVRRRFHRLQKIGRPDSAHLEFRLLCQQQPDQLRILRTLAVEVQLVLHLLECQAHKDAAAAVVQAPASRPSKSAESKIREARKAKDPNPLGFLRPQ